MAQRRDRLAGGIELAHEFTRLRRLAKEVGIDEAARDEQRVVIGLRYVGKQAVHRDAAGRLVQVHTTDAPAAKRDDVDVGAGGTQRRDGDRQFDLLEPVHGQHRDPSSIQPLLDFHGGSVQGGRGTLAAVDEAVARTRRLPCPGFCAARPVPAFMRRGRTRPMQRHCKSAGSGSGRKCTENSAEPRTRAIRSKRLRHAPGATPGTCAR